MRAARGWAIAAALVAAGGWWLRWLHLGTPSLWWDELVEIRMADRPALADVVRLVRLGIPAGAGNAGAVPLDYALLWAWLRLVPVPRPEALEAYFRAPSFFWSCALLPLAGWWTWRRAGVAAGLATITLAAGAVPLVLYAAEARFYSLFCFLVVVNLAAFTAVLDAPGRRGRWVGYGASAVALSLAGLFGLFVLPWQLATLALAGGRRARRRVGGVALAAGAVFAWYFADTNLAARSVRGPSVVPWLATTGTALRFFALGAPPLAWALAAAPVLGPLAAWRRTRSLRLALLCAALVVVATPPIIFTLVESRHHFFHPRHALFLLPMLLVLLGVAIGAAAERVASPRLAPGLALAGALALAGGGAARFATGPWWFFGHTKTLHDFRGMAALLRDRTRDYAADDRYLLIATRGPGGHLGNPVLAWYLEWYGLGDRVVLRATPDPAGTMARARDLCWTRCRNFGAVVERDLDLTRAYQHSRGKLRLLGQPARRPGWPGRPRHIGFAVYPPLARWHLGPLDGYRAWRLRGLHLYELARPPAP